MENRIKESLRPQVVDELRRRPPHKGDTLIARLDPATKLLQFEWIPAPELSLREQLSITPIEEDILNNIAAGLSGMAGQFVELKDKDVEPWMSPEPMAPRGQGRAVTLSDHAVRLRLTNNDFEKAEPGWPDFVKGVEQAFKGRLPEEEAGVSAVSWLTEAVALAKREHLQQTAWSLGQKIDGYYNWRAVPCGRPRNNISIRPTKTSALRKRPGTSPAEF